MKGISKELEELIACFFHSRRSTDGHYYQFEVAEIELDYSKTERNAPLREFLGKTLRTDPSPGCIISRDAFEVRSEILEKAQEVMNG